MPLNQSSYTTLLVDSREKRSGIGKRISSLGYSVKTKKLSIGDYSLPGKFIIERKEANDFVTSIMNGHLFHQAELLASHADQPFIILEGNLGDTYSAIDPESIAGAISALLLFYGIALAPSPSIEATTRLIGRMLKHASLGCQIDTTKLCPLVPLVQTVVGSKNQDLWKVIPMLGQLQNRFTEG